ncbi:MAG: aminotransferase class V-fold PLP-dependent enzyme [Planctomycetota bacterium]
MTDSAITEPASTEKNTLFRSDMPVTAEYAYFDHAAVAPLPTPAFQAMQTYAREAHEHGDAVWPRWSGKVAELRESCAELLRVESSEIALVNSTTQGINLVAEGMPWKDGDNILVPANEFPSNMVAWKNVERMGVEVRTINVPTSNEINAELFRPHLDERTRLIAFSWVGYSSGFRADVGSIVELAHGNIGRSGKTLVLLDTIQGLGAFPLVAKDTGVDFVCADGHKWMLGPEGAGLFYLKQEHLNLLQPLGLGWHSLAAGSFEPLGDTPLRSTLKQSAQRYEGGTTNMSGMLGFGGSLRLLLDSGLNQPRSAVQEAILENVACMEEQLASAGFETHLPVHEKNRSGIVGITWQGADEASLNQARKFLLQQKVVTSVRGGVLRASTHGYNNSADVQRLVEGLREFTSSRS